MSPHISSLVPRSLGQFIFLLEDASTSLPWHFLFRLYLTNSRQSRHLRTKDRLVDDFQTFNKSLDYNYVHRPVVIRFASVWL
jgi:hypothetical protein